MSQAFELIESGLLPEDDKEAAIFIILGFPLTPMERKYIYLDYAKIYGFAVTKEDVTKATGRSDI